LSQLLLYEAWPHENNALNVASGISFLLLTGATPGSLRECPRPSATNPQSLQQQCCIARGKH
jgi:hypothetical protein